MQRSNDFREVASSAIERVQQISRQFVGGELPSEGVERLKAELECHRMTLVQAFEYRKAHGPERSMADSDAYFREKLGAMIDFATKAVDPEIREGYSEEKIIDNVSHYSYLTARLVAADWRSSSTRPRTDHTLKDSSFENKEALERLVNR